MCGTGGGIYVYDRGVNVCLCVWWENWGHCDFGLGHVDIVVVVI